MWVNNLTGLNRGFSTKNNTPGLLCKPTLIFMDTRMRLRQSNQGVLFFAQIPYSTLSTHMTELEQLALVTNER